MGFPYRRTVSYQEQRSNLQRAEQDAEVAAAAVDDCQVGLAISVEIACCQAIGIEARFLACGRLEGAVAVAQQDAYRVASEVGGGEIGFAILVEVGKHQRVRLNTGSIVDR